MWRLAARGARVNGYRSGSLPWLWLVLSFLACSKPSAPLSPTANAAVGTLPGPVVSVLPTPAASDWKGLFDSELQENNVLPSAEVATNVLRHQPACTRVESVANGAFTAEGRDDQAYLLSCGNMRRVLIVSEGTTVATLDVSEETLNEAGDLDLDGDRELLLTGHQGTRPTVRVLGVQGSRLVEVYSFVVTPDACTHTVIEYRSHGARLEYRVEHPTKRCMP